MTREEQVIQTAQELIRKGETVKLFKKGQWFWIQARQGLEIKDFKFSQTHKAYFNKPMNMGIEIKLTPNELSL